MREIKFRAWDKQYKEMVKVTMMLLNCNPIEIDHDKNNGEPKSIENFELMQLTERMDENGVNIYEGDVVIDYSDKILVVEWNDDTCKFQFSDGTDINDGDRYGASVLVIGNIYEHPELLEVKNG